MRFLLILGAGTIAMLVPIFLGVRAYGVQKWKSIPVAFLLTIVGTIGTYLLYFVENGFLGGRSFYGAVFLVPLLFPLISKLVRIPYVQLMDFCAPAECVMLAIMKVQCLIEGCCGGKVISYTAEGVPTLFPSQLVEFLNAWVVFAILLILLLRKKSQGRIYPYYLVLYGITRFVLNYFRWEQSDFFLGMSPGNVWSLLAILIGVVWLFVMRKRVLSKEKDNVVI